jgi:hypothetical protein
MRRFAGFLSPTNWIYVLVHFCLLLIGFILLGYRACLLTNRGELRK